MSWTYIEKGRGGVSPARHADVRLGLREVRQGGGVFHGLTISVRATAVAARGLEGPLRARLALGSGVNAGKMRLDLAPGGDYAFRLSDGKARSFTMAVSTSRLPPIRRAAPLAPVACDHDWDGTALIVTLPPALLEAAPDAGGAPAETDETDAPGATKTIGGTPGGRAAASPNPSRPAPAAPTVPHGASAASAMRHVPLHGPVDAPKAGDRRDFSDAEAARQAAIARHLAEKGVTRCPTVALEPVAGGVTVPEADRAIIRRHDDAMATAGKPYHARHSEVVNPAKSKAAAKRAGRATS